MRHEILDAMKEREIVIIECKHELLASLINKKLFLRSQIETFFKKYGTDANRIQEYRELVYQYEKVSGLIIYLQSLKPF